jgi:CRP-like cAMP-binding protein
MDEKRLRALPLFEKLGRKERKFVAQRADEVDVAEGKRLATEGDFAYEFFIVEEGTAEVRHEGERLAELGPGDFFGEIALVRRGQRTADVVATSQMRLVVLTASDFRAMRRELPRVARQIEVALEKRAPAAEGAR